MKLYIQVRGDQSHPAILFLHGFMGLGNDWFGIADALSRDYFCILPDLPGHGLSRGISSDTPIDMKTTTEAIINILDDLHVDRVVSVGYSMGGRIALHMAIQFPQRISALLLESANPGIENETERIARAVLDDQRAEQLERDGLAVFIEHWYNAPLFASLHRAPEKLVLLMQSRLVHDTHSLAVALRGLTVGRQRSFWTELQKISIPTLLISGSLDSKYSAISNQMAARLPKCRHTEINNVGHNVHFEKPEEYLARLKEFLHDNHDQINVTGRQKT